ncbi:MAG TPA: hypothetical protein VNI61_10955, partial [Gemmatimonadales bacterium]|nr:hypothetical protein [Gemmatimonadales bacterium]
MGGELISREALERIVRRAAELQAAEREIGDGLTEAELLALGQDVGIPARFLRQALLEEQTRPVGEVPRGFWAWLAGPATLSALRVVPGERPAVEAALARWMDQEELLQPKRRFPDRTIWEPRAGAFASIQRALGGARRYALARAGEVSSQVTQLEPGFCLVRLEADVRRQRKERLGGGAALAGVGGVLAVAAATAGAPQLVPLIPAAAGVFLGALVARSHRAPNERTAVALEQVLDRLERGEIRPEHALPGPRASAFVRMAEEIRR